jgi:YD repeat-containing protein
LGDVTILPDALSRMQEHTDGKSQRTQYVYDKLDRIDRTTFHGGAVVDFTYDRDGNLISVSDPTGTTTMAYDGFGRSTSKTSPGTGTVRYEYDRNGNLTKFTDAGGDVVYAYNQANLLTSLREPGAPARGRCSCRGRGHPDRPPSRAVRSGGRPPSRGAPAHRGRGAHLRGPGQLN